MGEYIILKINLPTVLIFDVFLADALGLQAPAGLGRPMHWTVSAAGGTESQHDEN